MEYAKRAFEEMRIRAIAPTPNNFTIWYIAAAGRMPELNRTLDILDSNGQPFSEQRNDEIFARFFSTTDHEDAVADASSKLTDQMSLVLDNISTAHEDTGAYGDELGKALSALATVDGSGVAKATIEAALASTREMEAKNRALETRLQESSDEIENLREDLESLRQEAYTDGLTGIANRRRFDQVLRHAAMLASEQGTALSLLMIDIDHFKEFNDTHGHQIGDQVLRLLAATLRENVKGQDTPARYGGEEFAIVLPNTERDNAVILAEQIRRAISSKNVRNRRTGEDLGRITISIGVAAYGYGESLSQFIHRADQALYLAKHAGRNRVHTDTENETPQLPLEP